RSSSLVLLLMPERSGPTRPAERRGMWQRAHGVVEYFLSMRYVAAEVERIVIGGNHFSAVAGGAFEQGVRLFGDGRIWVVVQARTRSGIEGRGLDATVFDRLQQQRDALVLAE